MYEFEFNFHLFLTYPSFFSFLYFTCKKDKLCGICEEIRKIQNDGP